MATQADGLRASTGKTKDLRSTLKTAAARSLAAMDERLAHLENQNAKLSVRSEPAQSAIPTAAFDLDTALNNFGNAFNGLDERVSDLEKRDDGCGEVQTRLADAEERLKAYEASQAQAVHVAQQLADLERRIRAASDPVDTGIAKLVNNHDVSLREYSARLLQLEDHRELANAQSLSTADLAKTLLHRLKSGDLIERTLSRDLRLALGESLNVSATESTKQTVAALSKLPTPATDEVSSTQATAVEASVEAGNDEKNDMPTAKRRRTSRSMSRATTGRRTPNLANTPPSNKVGESSSANSVAREVAEEDRVAEADEEDPVIPPELRRTGRASKPTKHDENMVHWKEANKRMRSIRMSGP